MDNHYFAGRYFRQGRRGGRGQLVTSQASAYQATIDETTHVSQEVCFANAENAIIAAAQQHDNYQRPDFDHRQWQGATNYGPPPRDATPMGSRPPFRAGNRPFRGRTRRPYTARGGYVNDNRPSYFNGNSEYEMPRLVRGNYAARSRNYRYHRRNPNFEPHYAPNHQERVQPTNAAPWTSMPEHTQRKDDGHRLGPPRGGMPSRSQTQWNLEFPTLQESVGQLNQIKGGDEAPKNTTEALEETTEERPCTSAQANLEEQRVHEQRANASRQNEHLGNGKAGLNRAEQQRNAEWQCALDQRLADRLQSSRSITLRVRDRYPTFLVPKLSGLEKSERAHKLARYNCDILLYEIKKEFSKPNCDIKETAERLLRTYESIKAESEYNPGDDKSLEKNLLFKEFDEDVLIQIFYLLNSTPARVVVGYELKRRGWFFNPSTNCWFRILNIRQIRHSTIEGLFEFYNPATKEINVTMPDHELPSWIVNANAFL